MLLIWRIKLIYRGCLRDWNPSVCSLSYRLFGRYGLVGSYRHIDKRIDCGLGGNFGSGSRVQKRMIPVKKPGCSCLNAGNPQKALCSLAWTRESSITARTLG